MITLTLTEMEARKLRVLLEQRGNKDPDLGRVHHKLHKLMLKPAVKQKYDSRGWNNPLNKIGGDDD